MKKQDFDNRLQNDLFPEMPISFERKLKEAMENEGVKVKKRPTATGVFTGAVDDARQTTFATQAAARTSALFGAFFGFELQFHGSNTPKGGWLKTHAPSATRRRACAGEVIPETGN